MAKENATIPQKIALLEKEKRAGKQKVFKGLKQIKKEIGKPKAMQGVLKVREGNAQIRFAERQLARFRKRKKYWK